MDKPTCRTCVYWAMRLSECDQEHFDCGYDVSGICHRHAVQTPERYSNWWCGEHNDFPQYVELMSEKPNA